MGYPHILILTLSPVQLGLGRPSSRKLTAVNDSLHELRMNRSVVVHHLREQLDLQSDATVLFGYFNYKRAYSTVQLLETLLKQLGHRRLSCHRTITNLIQERSRQNRPSLEQITAALFHEVSTYRKVYVVLDALDEFPEESQQELVEQLRALPSNVHILVTSRDLPTISDMFQEDERLDIVADEGDMRACITRRISKSGTLNRLINKPPSLNQEVADSVIEKAHGM
jgi:Cdc6-like AAA superfamily ATPase